MQIERSAGIKKKNDPSFGRRTAGGEEGARRKENERTNGESEANEGLARIPLEFLSPCNTRRGKKFLSLFASSLSRATSSPDPLSFLNPIGNRSFFGFYGARCIDVAFGRGLVSFDRARGRLTTELWSHIFTVTINKILSKLGKLNGESSLIYFVVSQIIREP